jgi:hypothetical protein
MNLSKNTLVLQNELKSTLNKKSVTGGRSVENSTIFPTVLPPSKIEKNNDGDFNIFDEAGRIVGVIPKTIVNILLGASGAVVGVAGNVVNAAGNVVNASTDAFKNVLIFIVDSSTGLIKSGIYTLEKISSNLVRDTSNVLDSGIKIGTGFVNTGINTVGNASNHLITGTSNIVETGINTTADVATDSIKTAQNVSSNLISGTEKVLTTGINSGVSVIREGTDTINNVSHDILSGTSDVVTNGLHTSAQAINTGVDTVEHASTNLITGTADAVSGLRNSVLNTSMTESHETPSNFKSSLPSQSGGVLLNGVSVLNIEDSSDVNTRMLISNNFLDSKHVYFVRYHPNGTNVYDYKLGLKGGKVTNLELRNTNSIWNNGNSVGSISNNTLSNSINVINNVITDLSNSPQVGGYVRNSVADKNDFYNKYKNYKLKYLSLKNNM